MLVHPGHLPLDLRDARNHAKELGRCHFEDARVSS
jgi:hypothetical protein